MKRLIISFFICFLFAFHLNLPVFAQDEILGEATIYWDSYGVPHIYSANTEGLFYAFGYAEAKCRLHQLESFRRLSAGTMSEVYGSGFVNMYDADIDDNKVDIQDQFNALDEEYKTVAIAFTAGVNAYIDEVLADPDNKLPYEFTYHDYLPVRWSIFDSVEFLVSTMKFIGNELNNQKIYNYLIDRYGEEEGNAVFDDLVWGNDPGAPTSIPSTEKSFVKHDKKLKNTCSNRKVIQGVENALKEIENKWEKKVGLHVPTGLSTLADPECMGLAISPSKSSTGNALFMGGPQIWYTVPSGFFEVGLHLKDGSMDVIGAAGLGTPVITFGCNKNIAFTYEAAVDNNIDIFIEELNPNNKYQYLYNSEYRDMELKTATIKVKDQEELELATQFFTIHGPVMSFDDENGLAYAYRWTAAGEELSNFVATYEAMKAKNVEQFGTAVKKNAVATNYVCADNEGNIGYWHVGRYAIRAEDVDDRLPVSGTGEYEWQGLMSLEDIPCIINPDQGYLTDWNAKPIAGWSNGDRCFRWGQDHRVQRFIDLMAEKEKFSFAEVKDIIWDISFIDLKTRWYKPYLMDALDGYSGTEERVAQAKQLLNEWDNYRTDTDGDGYLDSAAISMWDKWWTNVIKNTFEDELGKYYTNVDQRYGAGLFLRALLGDEAPLSPSRDYFNGKQDEVLVNSLIDAMDELKEEYGTSDMSQWLSSSGSIHFDKYFMGIPQSEGEVSDIPIKMNRGIINHVVELTSPTNTGINIIPPGNNGFMKDAETYGDHFDDQLEMFVNFQYKDMLLNEEDIKTNAELTEKLVYTKMAGISGIVLGMWVTPVSRVSIKFNEERGNITDSKGSFSETGFKEGEEVVIKPEKFGYWFFPESSTVNIGKQDITALFFAFPETYTVSGTIKDSDDNPITNSLVIFQLDNDLKFAFTDNEGIYQIGGVYINHIYTIAPIATGYDFTPQGIAVTGNLTEVNFIAN